MVLYDKMHLLNDAECLNKNTVFQNEPCVSRAQTYLCTGAQDIGVNVAVMSSLGAR